MNASVAASVAFPVVPWHVGKRRLLKLAAFLVQLKPEKFNYRYWVSEKDSKGCGTVCCAGGWCPVVFPRYWRYASGESIALREGGNSVSTIGDLAAFFGIRYMLAKYLFMPAGGVDSGPLPSSATAKEVAAHIRKFCKEHKP